MNVHFKYGFTPMFSNEEVLTPCFGNNVTAHCMDKESSKAAVEVLSNPVDAMFGVRNAEEAKDLLDKFYEELQFLYRSSHSEVDRKNYIGLLDRVSKLKLSWLYETGKWL